MGKARVLCIERFGLGGKKDIELLAKLPGVEKVISGDFHYRVGNLEENQAYLQSMPESQKRYYTDSGIDPDHFIDKSLDELVNDYLEECDAVYIPGASFDPSTENCVDIPTKISEDKRRENFELKLIQTARERGIPVLAVCAGSWRLANAFGGKTEALSESDTAKHDQWDKIREMSEPVEIKKGTMLHGTHIEAQEKRSIHFVGDKAEKDLVKASSKITDFDATTLNVNSSHWRVSKAPEDQKNTQFEQQFETSAIDKKTGTVEAFESKHGVPTMGVQFHPEYSIPVMIKEDKSQIVQQDYKTHKSILDNWVRAGQTHRNKQEMNNELKQLTSSSDDFKTRYQNQITINEEVVEKNTESKSPTLR